MTGFSGELSPIPKSTSDDLPVVATPPVAPVPAPNPSPAAGMFLIEVVRPTPGTVRRAIVQALPAESQDMGQMLIPANGDLAGYFPQPIFSDLVLAAAPRQRDRSRRRLVAGLTIAVFAIALVVLTIQFAFMRRELLDAQNSMQPKARSQNDQVLRSEVANTAKQNAQLKHELQQTSSQVQKLAGAVHNHDAVSAIINEKSADSALRATTKLIETMKSTKSSDRVDLIRDLATRASEQSRFGIALVCYQQLIDWAGESTQLRHEALLGLAQTYDRQNRLADAGDAYHELVEFERHHEDKSSDAQDHLARFAILSLRAKPTEDDADLAIRAIDRLLANLDLNDKKVADQWRPRLLEIADAAMANHLTGLAARVLERATATGEFSAQLDPMLVQLYLGIGKPDDARRILLRAMPKNIEDDPSITDPNVASCAIQVAQLDEQRGDLASAEKMLKSAMRIRERALGPNHPDVADVIFALSRLYEREGRHSEADAFRTTASEIWAKQPPRGLR